MFVTAKKVPFMMVHEYHPSIATGDQAQELLPTSVTAG